MSVPEFGLRHESILGTAPGQRRRRWMLLLAMLGLLATAMALTCMGIASIATTEPALAKRQAVFAAAGLVAAVIMMLPSPQRLRWAAEPLFVVSLVLLVFVLLPGVPEWLVRPKNGARRWISLGLFEFQPSEIARIAVVLVTAKALWVGGIVSRFRGLLLPLVVAAVPMVLILLEPDLGTAMLLVPAVIATVLVAGARLRHLLLLATLALVVGVGSYWGGFLKAHQRDRIDALLAQLSWDNNDRYVRGIGFQADRAKTLASSGGMSGLGAERARDLVRHNGLPEEHNDMIFAVVCCRWGFVGGAVVLALGAGYALAAMAVASEVGDPFSRLVTVALGAMFAGQLCINAGMTLGVMPVTGVTLPFVSYGGSSLVALWMQTGLVMGLALRRLRGATGRGSIE